MLRLVAEKRLTQKNSFDETNGVISLRHRQGAQSASQQKVKTELPQLLMIDATSYVAAQMDNGSKKKENSRMGKMGRALFLGFCLFIFGCATSPPRSLDGRYLLPAPPEIDGPNLTAALKNRGLWHYQRGEFVDAIVPLTLATFQDPTGEVWTKLLLAYCYVSQGDYHLAIDLGEKLIHIDPYQSQAYLLTGIARLLSGNPRQAYGYFQKTLEFEGHPARAHFYAGLALEKMKRFPERDKTFSDAEKEYAQILRLNPKDFSANYELASLYLYWNRELEKVSFLLTQCQESISQMPDDNFTKEKKLFNVFHVPVLRGILAYRRGDPLNAQKLFLEVLQDLPPFSRADLAELLHFLGLTYTALGQPEPARQYFEQALQWDPHGAYANDTSRGLRKIASEAPEDRK